ncbi:hypothetical protein JCM15124A_18730 [Prevotella falsenii]
MGIAVATVMVKGTEMDIAAATEKAKGEKDTAVATIRTNKHAPRRAVCMCRTYSAAIQPTRNSSPQAFVTKRKKERETICPM